MKKKLFTFLSVVSLAIVSPTYALASSPNNSLPGSQCETLGETATYVAWTFSAKLKCSVSTYGNAWEIVSTTKVKPKTSSYIKPDGISDTQYGVVLWGTCNPPYALGWYQGVDEGQG